MTLARHLGQILHRSFALLEERIEEAEPHGLAEQAETGRGGVDVRKGNRRVHASNTTVWLSLCDVMEKSINAECGVKLQYFETV